MEISCVFSTTLWYPENRHFYTCSIIDSDLTSSNNFYFNFNSQQSLKDIEALAILESKIFQLPRQFQIDFKNIKILCVKQTNLTIITRDDIREFQQLTELWMPNNKLKSLSGDLFADNQKIERISFSCNRIERIGNDLLTPLVNLKFANFRRNLCIDAIFDVSQKMTIEELKLNFEKNSSKSIQTDEQKFQSDLNKFLYNENFKDFTIKGQKRSFKVHKFVMAARSSVICEMVEKTPRLSGISLVNISDEVIEEILDYFYDDIMPNFKEFSNTLMVYDLAMKMNLSEVIIASTREIVMRTRKENSVDVLEIAAKYKDLEIMSIAFEKIKEIFPRKKFKKNLLNDDRKVQNLIKELKNYWKNIDETVNRFNDMNFFDNDFGEFDSGSKN